MVVVVVVMVMIVVEKKFSVKIKTQCDDNRIQNVSHETVTCVVIIYKLSNYFSLLLNRDH